MGRPNKILIHTIGSRGDVQPFIGLAAGLQRAGFQVYFLTNKNHVSALHDSNLEGEGIFFDSEKEHQEHPGLVKAMADGNIFSLGAALTELYEKHADEHVRLWFEAMERIKPDLVLSGSGGNAFGAIAERKMRIPVVNIELFCIAENPERMLMGLPNLPCCCNKWLVWYLLAKVTYGIFNTYSPACDRLKGFKVTDIFPEGDFVESIHRPAFMSLIAVSPLVAKVLDPSPAATRKYIGYLPADAKVEVANTAGQSGIFGSSATIESIKSFLAAGKQPVYMGWGSMMAKSPEELATMVAKAVQIAGSRAIVYQGWANIDAETLRKATKDQALIEYAEKNLLFVGKTPHDWLFPQCSCIVHHGGSGTMATAARAGTPQIITPVFLDQWDHAYFLNKFGAGVGFEKTQLNDVTAKELGEAIKKCESSPAIKAKAAGWGATAKSEDPVQRVVENLEWFWTECVETRKYEQHVTARLQALGQQR